MVTGQARKSRRRVVYLREHRKAKGAKAIDLATLLKIERESYYRLERAPLKLSAGELAQLEEALEIEPGALWHPPGAKSGPGLDALVQDSPPETQSMIVDVVRRLAGK